MFTPDRLTELFRFPFTPQAANAINFAECAVDELRHSSIGTGHLLLGILRVDPAIEALGIDSRKAKGSVKFLLSKQGFRWESELSDEAKQAIRSSIEGAKVLRHPSLQTPHIMLGLMEDRMSLAVGILEDQGFTVEELRAKIIRAMAENEQVAEKTKADYAARFDPLRGFRIF